MTMAAGLTTGAADRQAAWFVKRLVGRLGGKEACARLLEELDA